MDKRKPLPINHDLKEYAVKMRKNQTDEEKLYYNQQWMLSACKWSEGCS